MVRQRIRFRFSKQDDLRFVGHRDLMNAVERLFRRADVRLATSEGFHPKPKMNFPSALALGVQGDEELLEIELAEQADPPKLLDALRRLAPPGLEFLSAESIPDGAPKPRVCRATYEMPIPENRLDGLQEKIDRLWALESYCITRENRATAIDLRADLCELRLEGPRLRIALAVTGQAGVRPADVLVALELDDLLAAGSYLTRTELHIEPFMPKEDAMHR